MDHDGDIDMTGGGDSTEDAPDVGMHNGADARGGAGANAGTPPPTDAVNLHGLPVFVPLQQQEDLVRRLAWPHTEAERANRFRIMTMQEVAQGFQSTGGGAPKGKQKQEDSATAQKDALQNIRRVVYAQCKARIKYLASQLVEQNLPGMDQHGQEMLVDRLASQLSAWAVYAEIPQDLRRHRREHLDRQLEELGQLGGPPSDDGDGSVLGDGGQSATAPTAPGPGRTPALLVGQRERDARLLQRADAGKLDGPLPGTNMALQDAQVSAVPAAAQAKRKKAASDAIMVLASALTGRDPTTGEPRPASLVLARARQLASGDGVLMVRDQDHDPSPDRLRHAILLRAQETHQLLHSDPKAVPTSKSDTKALLNTWQKARKQDREQTDRGIKYNRLPDDALEVFSQPRLVTDMGYKCKNRMAYYRRENLVVRRGEVEPSLPLRTGLPMARTTLTAFLQENRAKLDTTGSWRMAPDMLLPTSRMMNLLIRGDTPYHMSAHAMLDEYTAMIRFAIDRLASPGVRPPSLTHKDAWISDTEMLSLKNSAVTKAAEQAAALVFLPLRSETAAWKGLPDWCGMWFLPQAFLPVPSADRSVDVLYPAKDPTHHPWLREVLAPILVKGQMNGTMELTHTALIDAFGNLCSAMEAQVAEQRKQAREKQETSQPPTEMMVQDKRSQDQAAEGEQKEPEVPKGMVMLDTEQNLNAAIAEREVAMLKPDRSRAGRAETLMGLRVMPTYYTMVRQCVMQHDVRIEQARERHGPGVDCGNGFSNVRPAAYYHELWNLCIAYTSQLLEIHELVLLLLNSRWLDTDKVRDRMTKLGHRLDPRCVQHAHPTTVANTLERRRTELQRRMAVDPRGPGMQRGPDPGRGWPGADGRFPAQDQGAWVQQQLQSKVLQGRPDLPTYLDLVLFDHLLDYVPVKHELAQYGASGQGPGGSDPAVEALIRRTKSMEVRSAQEAKIDPTRAMRHHQLPTDDGPQAKSTGAGVFQEKRQRGGARMDPLQAPTPATSPAIRDLDKRPKRYHAPRKPATGVPEQGSSRDPTAGADDRHDATMRD